MPNIPRFTAGRPRTRPPRSPLHASSARTTMEPARSCQRSRDFERQFVSNSISSCFAQRRRLARRAPALPSWPQTANAGEAESSSSWRPSSHASRTSGAAATDRGDGGFIRQSRRNIDARWRERGRCRTMRCSTTVGRPNPSWFHWLGPREFRFAMPRVLPQRYRSQTNSESPASDSRASMAHDRSPSRRSRVPARRRASRAACPTSRVPLLIGGVARNVPRRRMDATRLSHPLARP